jgi:HTH-type transcriptional regulator/antitoxin HigA
MNIKPIRRAADYDAALRRIEVLWGSGEGTHEGDELDVLVTLAETYEREHYPVDPLTMIRRLHSQLRIPAQVLIQSAPTGKRRGAARATSPQVRRRTRRLSGR